MVSTCSRTCESSFADAAGHARAAGTRNGFSRRGKKRPFLSSDLANLSDQGFDAGNGAITVNGDPGPQPVPEPGTLLLLGAGFAALGARQRFRSATLNMCARLAARDRESTLREALPSV
jgi:hypothetical protein